MIEQAGVLWQANSQIQVVGPDSGMILPAGAFGGVLTLPNLILWLPIPTTACAPYSNNASVSVVHDQSGLSHDLAQATGGDQPTFLTNQINGLPALSFDGFRYLSGATAPGYWGGSGATIFLVFTIGTANSRQMAGDAAGTIELGQYLQQLDCNVAGTHLTDPTNLTENTAYVATFLINGASSVLYKNGAIAASGALTNTAVGGFQYSVGQSMYGLSSELIICNEPLPTGPRHQGEAYLGAKYGIAMVQQ